MDVRFAVPEAVCHCFAQFREILFRRRESCPRCFGRPPLRGKLIGFFFGLAASNSFNFFDPGSNKGGIRLQRLSAHSLACHPSSQAETSIV
jgi:hypothetical protein